MEQEIGRRIGAASAVMWTLHRSVVVKRELSQKAKLSIYRSILVPTLTYCHKLWVMTERTRSRVQAAEMSFLRRVAGLSLRDRARSSAIREELGVEPLLLHVERNQMRWIGHLVRMPLDTSLMRCSGHIPPDQIMGQQPQQLPDFPVPRNFIHLFREYSEASLGQRVILSPTSPGSASGPPPGAPTPSSSQVTELLTLSLRKHPVTLRRKLTPVAYVRNLAAPGRVPWVQIQPPGIACKPQPKAWLQSGASVTPIRDLFAMGGPTSGITAPDNLAPRFIWAHKHIDHSKVVVQGGGK
ncbi:hypothetical protein D4764_09G0009990 [Takifugu flavidus]|uniref:Uncharacterized protein n=1 Tax=Takifugu flavidus TaxID=433684 RepID=A0A5C6MMG1_9TELE|nr:hypothetical protein D4764_09G0009990 [Takifugu flavidus]